MAYFGLILVKFAISLLFLFNFIYELLKKAQINSFLPEKLNENKFKRSIYLKHQFNF